MEKFKTVAMRACGRSDVTHDAESFLIRFRLIDGDSWRSPRPFGHLLTAAA